MSPRPAAPGRCELGEAVERLAQLYAQQPALACLGLFEHSCGEHIDASTAGVCSPSASTLTSTLTSTHPRPTGSAPP